MFGSISSCAELSLAIQQCHKVCGDTQNKLAKALQTIEVWKDSMHKECS